MKEHDAKYRWQARTSMRRRILSKSTWRPLCGERSYCAVNAATVPFARYASIHSVGELTLVSSSVHYGIRLDSGSTEALRYSERPSWKCRPSSQLRSRLLRSEARSGERTMEMG